MKLAIVWNVWNNYQDTLLGSEMARLGNERERRFEKLHLVSQGGYPTLPSEEDRRYLDGHFAVEINEDNELVRHHVKFKGVFRVLNGIRHAYEYARRQGCDYALVTNADAWCLDLSRLADLLDREDVRRSAVSARIGLVTGLDINYGCFVPFFDDHFMILNVPLCERHGVFDYEEPKAYRAHFASWGGIHYILTAMMDERVPPGFFNIYTHLEDCVNHFGERSGYSLLPWQYQPRFSFLHANCAQEPDLHPLRAAMLRLHGLDRYPAIGEYCRAHAGGSESYGHGDGYVHYRRTVNERLGAGIAMLPHKLYRRFLRAFKYERHARLKRDLFGGVADALEYYDRYREVLPLELASRRRTATAQQP